MTNTIENDKVKELNEKLNDEILQQKEELTDEEKKELYIKQLKESRKKFQPLTHPTKVIDTYTEENFMGRKHKIKERIVQTNVTKNKFDVDYKKKRKKKLKMTKISRKNNRKK